MFFFVCFLFSNNFVYLLDVKTISVGKFLYSSESQPEVILPLVSSGDILGIFGNVWRRFLVVTTRKVSGAQWPEMLLNILEMPRMSPTTKNYPAPKCEQC